MSLHNLSYFQVLSLLASAPELQVNPATLGDYEVGPGVLVLAVEYELLHVLEVVLVDSLGEGEYLGHVERHDHLLNFDVGVGRDDGPAREVDSFATEVASETAMLTLESLE